MLDLFQDGALAWDAKDYLIEQERCADVQIEQKTYHGLHTEQGKKEASESKSKSKKDKKKKKKKAKKDEL